MVFIPYRIARSGNLATDENRDRIQISRMLWKDMRVAYPYPDSICWPRKKNY